MSDIECSVCGRDGGPYEGCSRGCDGNPRFIQSAGYTLTQHRNGDAPKEDRYTNMGPKTNDPMWTSGS